MGGEPDPFTLKTSWILYFTEKLHGGFVYLSHFGIK